MTNIAREILFETSSEIADATTFISLAYGELIQLFGDYESAQGSLKKQRVAAQIFRDLALHLQLEEEIFYPAIKTAFKDSGLVSLAAMSHSLLRYLLAEIKSLDADSLVYDIKLRLLGDHIKLYSRESQSKLAKLNCARKVDLWRLADQLVLARQVLANDYGMAPPANSWADLARQPLRSSVPA